MIAREAIGDIQQVTQSIPGANTTPCASGKPFQYGICTPDQAGINQAKRARQRLSMASSRAMLT